MFEGILQDKKKLAIIAGVIIVVFILAVIFWPRPAPVEQVNDREVKLTWWKPFYGNNTYTEAIRKFTQIPGNSRVKIEVVNKPYDSTNYYKNLVTDIALGAGPSIFTIRNDDLPAYRDFMLPLRNIQGEDLNKYKEDFSDIVVQDTIYRGNVYAVTSYVDNLQLYYNKNILAQSGIALPPKSWDELDRQLSRLNKRSVDSINFQQHAISLGTGGRGLDGGENINRHVDIMPMLLFQAGGDMFDSQKNEVVFGLDKNRDLVNNNQITSSQFTTNSERNNLQNTPAYNSVRFYADFADVTRSRYSWNTSSINNVDAFAEGKLAYLISYSYMQDILLSKNPRLEYGVARLPQVDENNKRTYGFYFMDGINRELDKPERRLERTVAENFLKFLTNKEQQLDFVTRTRLPAAHKDVIKEQLAGDEVLRIFAEGSQYAKNYYKPDVLASEKIWSDMMERIQYEGMSVGESLQIAVNQYSLIVNNGPKTR